MRILGIETSCDETAAAIVENGKTILSNIVSSQIKLHKKYGGIVPEVAARAHLESIIFIIDRAFKKAGLYPKNIDRIAVTRGPGLISSLMIGCDTAKSLSLAWNKPLVGINHLEGHIYACWLKGNQKEIKFPALCLIVSGGHTELILMKNHGKYKEIGSTRDDAAGEAFDKVAKLLGLKYPGGPIVSKLAEKGDPRKIDLPRPMLSQNPEREETYDFSFAGLKTAVLEKLRDRKSKPHWKFIYDICASFQLAVIDVLIKKTICAAKEYKAKTILATGGVAANKLLRKTLKKTIKKRMPGILCLMPDAKLCTDNAAKIAAAAFFHTQKKGFDSWKTLEINPNLKIKTN